MHAAVWVRSATHVYCWVVFRFFVSLPHASWKPYHNPYANILNVISLHSLILTSEEMSIWLWSHGQYKKHLLSGWPRSSSQQKWKHTVGNKPCGRKEGRRWDADITTESPDYDTEFEKAASSLISWSAFLPFRNSDTPDHCEGSMRHPRGLWSFRIFSYFTWLNIRITETYLKCR